MNINERIKVLRKEGLKMNMEEFGELLGITKSGVSEIESGRRNVTDQHIKMLTVAPVKSKDDGEKNINADWLRTGEGEMFVPLDEEIELMQWAGRVLSQQPQDFQKRFVKMLMKLSDAEWKILEAKVLELAADAEAEKKED